MKNILLSFILFPLFLSAQDEEIPGCMNFYSSNYNSEATIDDGSCAFTQATISEFTFTNCGQEGRYGPDQNQVDNAYSGTNLEGQVISNNGIQEWVVPFSGTYTIEAFGAQGGYSTYGYMGGYGAMMSGEVYLESGQLIQILVGQQGGQSSEHAAGGGGGSFVAYNNTPIIVSGGGSGGGGNFYPSIGQPGLTSLDAGSTSCCSGGTNGYGGSSSLGSGGAGGFYGDGMSGYSSTAGVGFLSGGFGGSDGCGYGGYGGFGGGSGGEWCFVGASGAGGGYSGGAGTNENGVASGGGSFNAGENQDNIAGSNEGHGRVIITALNLSSGCTNEIAMNYSPSAVSDDGSCLVLGCIFPMFPNYNAQANIDDGTCDMGSENTFGCTHEWAVNYNELATDNDGSCYREGCTLYWGDNYDELATLEDGSCIRLGCTDETAFNYDSYATYDDGLCIPVVLGCMDITYFEYNPEANVEDGTCYTPGVLGCTDETAFNYYSAANIDDGSCVPVVLGCMDYTYVEYNPEANINEGCNILKVYGCTDPSYTEYWNYIALPSGLYILNYPLIDGVNTDDGSCATEIIYGCTYEDFEEYNPEANVTGADDCLTLIGYGCTDQSACNYNMSSTSDDGSCIYSTDLNECASCSGEQDGTGNILDNNIDGNCNQLTGFYPPSGSICLNSSNDTIDCDVQSILELQSITQIVGPYAYVNSQYSDTILFYADDDFTINIDNQLIEFDFVSAEISNVSLPDGMSYYCNSDDCMFYPNEWGNIILGGTPLSEGTYHLDIEAVINLNLAPSGIDSDLSINIPYDGSNPILNTVLGESDFSVINNIVPDFVLIVSDIIYGCTDSSALNYDGLSTEDDGSCEYYIDESCVIPDEYLPQFYYGNTGSNMTVLVGDVFVELLPINSDNPYIVVVSESGEVYGSVNLTEDYGVGSPAFNQLSVWGDDTASPEIDGYIGGDNINYQLVDGNNLYNIIPTYDYQEEGYILDFSVNAFGGMLTGIESITPICGLQLGCTSDWADNYDELATEDDGSCYRYGCTSDWADNYDELATTDDGSCDRLGCTSDWADNYDELATEDDGSCYRYGCTSDWADNYDELATEDDGSCDRLGCTSDWADNYDELATEDNGSCYKLGCMAQWADNYDPYATNDNSDLPEEFSGSTGSNMTIFLTSGVVSSLPITSADPYIVALNSAGLVVGSASLAQDDLINGQQSIAVWGDDTQTPEVDGMLSGEEIYFQLVDGNSLYDINFAFAGPNSFITNGTLPAIGVSYEIVSGNSSCIRLGCMADWADNYDELATEDDGSCIRLGCTADWADNYDELATEDDGSCVRLGCTDSNDCVYDSLATEDNGSCVGPPGCTEEFYVEYNPQAGCHAGYLCQTSWLEAYDSLELVSNQLVNLNTYYIDSIQGLQANNLSLENEILSNIVEYNYVTDSLTQQIDLISFNYQQEIDYLSSPIPIDLLLGWNIIGYTYREPQDAVATLQEITDIIEIVKNNAAEVYWPEYGFNGIGDLIPGQGYQIKVSEEYSGFTYLDTEGQRIELTPTVPQWAIDMEVEMHPNDIRSLVRVVNMLGQEVNPEMEPRGSVLLYLYNDATVEKKLVE